MPASAANAQIQPFNGPNQVAQPSLKLGLGQFRPKFQEYAKPKFLELTFMQLFAKAFIHRLHYASISSRLLSMELEGHLRKYRFAYH